VIKAKQQAALEVGKKCFFLLAVAVLCGSKKAAALVLVKAKGNRQSGAVANKTLFSLI
jgi:hypothetical protein